MSSKYGLIGEDYGHISCLTSLIKKIRKENSLSYDKFVGNGCGPVKRKASQWAQILKRKGCKRLILIHDLDRNDFQELEETLKEALSSSPFSDQLICIPVEEIEAWLISDLAAIYKFFNIKKSPKEYSNPEMISSPKEEIEKIVRKETCGEKVYLHTKHNQNIIELISIEKIRKCKQFTVFEAFVLKNT